MNKEQQQNRQLQKEIADKQCQSPSRIQKLNKSLVINEPQYHSFISMQDQNSQEKSVDKIKQQSNLNTNIQQIKQQHKQIVRQMVQKIGVQNLKHKYTINQIILTQNQVKDQAQIKYFEEQCYLEQTAKVQIKKRINSQQDQINQIKQRLRAYQQVINKNQHDQNQLKQSLSNNPQLNINELKNQIVNKSNQQNAALMYKLKPQLLKLIETISQQIVGIQEQMQVLQIKNRSYKQQLDRQKQLFKGKQQQKKKELLDSRISDEQSYISQMKKHIDSLKKDIERKDKNNFKH